MTGSSRGIDNFVIKNGEVEGKAEPDRVRRLHFRLRNVKRLLVRLLRILDYRCKCKSVSIQITSSTTSFLRCDHPSNKLSWDAAGEERDERKDERKLDKRGENASEFQRFASRLSHKDPRVSFHSELRRPWTGLVVSINRHPSSTMWPCWNVYLRPESYRVYESSEYSLPTAY